MADTITFKDIKLEAGRLIITPQKEDLGKAMAVVRKHKDRLYDLEIKEHRKKRSLDANAYIKGTGRLGYSGKRLDPLPPVPQRIRSDYPERKPARVLPGISKIQVSRLGRIQTLL